jgi:hypothetical protein
MGNECGGRKCLVKRIGLETGNITEPEAGKSRDPKDEKMTRLDGGKRK